MPRLQTRDVGAAPSDLPQPAAQSASVRILIVKTSSMGDVVHALPLAADLAAHLAGARIDWLVEEGFAAIPAMSRHVHRVHRVALRRWRRAPLRQATWSEIARLKNDLRAERYDRVLDVQGLLKSAVMARWAGAPVAGPSSSSARERVASSLYSQAIDVPRAMHAVERCRRIGAGAFGYPLEGPARFDLAMTASPSFSASGPHAALLVNASRAAKLWPDDRWIVLERWLAERGLRSLLFWATPEEESRTTRLASAMRCAEVAPRSTIESIAAALAAVQLAVGLDTGLTHLAAALGRPAVGIYCDYDPQLVGLVGDAPVRSLGGVGQLPSVDDVIAAAQAVIGETR